MADITYTNKDKTGSDGIVNKWRDVDANEVKTAVNSKQDTLISATNIKTVNGATILGSGDLLVGSGGGTGDVVGPASAVDSRMVEFDGTTGKLIKDGGVVVSTFVKTVLDDANAGAVRTTIGAGTGNGDVVSPMTTAGDLIIGGASGTPTRLAAGSTSGHVLTSNGSGAAPSYQAAPGGGGSGDVTGPASSTDDNIATYNGTTGKIIKDGGSKITDLVPTSRTIAALALSGDITSSQLRSSIFDTSRYVRAYCDFFATLGDFMARLGSTGSVGLTGTDPGGTPGIAIVSTGANAAGFAYVSSQPGDQSISLGNGETIFECKLNIVTLSDGTNRFVVIAGFHDSIATGNAVDGVYFRGIDSENSGNWTCVSRINTATETITNTAVPITTNRTKFRIIVNAAGTQALFYIDNVLVATHTTIPTGSGREVSLSVGMLKSIGTTARTMNLDYISLLIELTTQR